MDESVIISRTEKYLNKIQRESITLESISKLEGCISVYNKLKEHLKKLQEIKDIMDIKGYTAPYRSLSKYGSNSSEIAFEEVSEVNRHGQYFRMKANAKKNILDRVKSAIDSHKIAIGHLEEYGIVVCESCLKRYKISSFKDMEYECSCSSSKFKLEVNEKTVHRVGIIPYLPLSGNYMVLISQLSKWGRESFKNVLNILKQEKKGSVRTISAVIRIMEKKREIRKRVTFDSEYIDSYEEEIRKKYGKNVRIEVLQFNRVKPTIINDKHARMALAIGYVKYCENIVKRNEKVILKENLKNFDKLNTYNKVVREVKLEKPIFIDENDSIKSWQELEVEKRLKELKLIGRNNIWDSELKKDKVTLKNLKKNLFSKIASTLILWDVSKYYLITSNDRRKRHGGPFPYLRVEIDRKQRRIFQNLDVKVVKLLKFDENEKIISLDNMDFILNEKFNLEKKIKGSNMQINYSALGAALICLNSEIAIDTAANTFNVKKSAVEKEIKNIETIKNPKSKKSKKFLEIIKKK